MSDYFANRRGIIALTSAGALVSASDVFTKLVALRYPLGEVLVLRGTAISAFLLAFIFIAKKAVWLSAALHPRVLVRSAFDALANLGFIFALTRMKLAELTAIFLVAPLFLTMLAAIFHKGEVGIRRWSAMLAGFLGMTFVVKPDPSAIDIWAIVALVAALMSALRDFVTRDLNADIPNVVVAFVSSVTLTLSGLIVAAGLGERWEHFNRLDAYLVIGAALFLTASTYLTVIAYRKIEIPVVAPFRYVILVWAGLAGYLVWREIPDLWSSVGVGLIFGSGVYTLHRERLRHRMLSVSTSIH